MITAKNNILFVLKTKAFDLSKRLSKSKKKGNEPPYNGGDKKLTDFYDDGQPQNT